MKLPSCYILEVGGVVPALALPPNREIDFDCACVCVACVRACVRSCVGARCFRSGWGWPDESLPGFPPSGRPPVPPIASALAGRPGPGVQGGSRLWLAFGWLARLALLAWLAGWLAWLALGWPG